jgi:polyferredoxin
MPSIDSLDPFGGVETLFKYRAGGDFIKKIIPANIVLLAAIIVLGVVLSRFFCGWICAFGALQGVFGWLGRKIFKRRFIVPVKLDRVLRWAKYPVRVGIIYFTWTTGTLIIRPYGVPYAGEDGSLAVQAPAAAPSAVAPLRDMKDTYGYTMPVLKERIAQ